MKILLYIFAALAVPLVVVVLIAAVRVALGIDYYTASGLADIDDKVNTGERVVAVKTSAKGKKEIIR